MKLFKLFLAAAGATVLLGALVSIASATRLRSSSTTLKMTFASLTFEGVGTAVCAVTLEGSYHSATIAKVTESLIGYITRAVIGGTHCIRGSATILQTSLPWHVRYESFTGTLPNISAYNTTLTGTRISYKDPVFLIECLAFGGTQHISHIREAGGVLTSARISGESPTSCGTSIMIEGASNSLTVLNNTTRISVTLI
jgi:hypothetical protein